MNNNEEFDFTGHLKTLEDAQAVQLPNSGEKTLTDAELELSGLIKTSAFVRTKRSKNALRVEKSKAKKKVEEGIGQLNVQVPDAYREDIKQLIKRIADGQSLIDAASAVSAPQAKKAQGQTNRNTISGDDAQLVRKCSEVLVRGGFRAFLLRHIIK